MLLLLLPSPSAPKRSLTPPSDDRRAYWYRRLPQPGRRTPVAAWGPRWWHGSPDGPAVTGRHCDARCPGAPRPARRGGCLDAVGAADGMAVTRVPSWADAPSCSGSGRPHRHSRDPSMGAFDPSERGGSGTPDRTRMPPGRRESVVRSSHPLDSRIAKALITGSLIPEKGRAPAPSPPLAGMPRRVILARASQDDPGYSARRGRLTGWAAHSFRAVDAA